MAEKKTIKCYHYEANGDYLGEFKSIEMARQMYYSCHAGKYPMFVKHENIHIFPDQSIVSKRRIGRDAVVRFLKFENNPFRSSDRSKIEIFDIEFNKIAEFSNKKTCSILTGLTMNQINSYLRNRAGNLPSNELGLIFKYKIE